MIYPDFSHFFCFTFLIRFPVDVNINNYIWIYFIFILWISIQSIFIDKHFWLHII